MLNCSTFVPLPARLLELTSELEVIERRGGDLWYLQWTLLVRVCPAGPRGVGRWLERSRGNYQQALAEGRSAVQLAAPGERDRWSAWTRATFGWTLLELRAAQDAVDVLEEALVASELLSDRFRAAGHLA